MLHHTGHGEPHFDLLVESPAGPLVTLRLPAWPVCSRLTFERLPDHRAIYLDYEGPISGNRGEVRRVEAGTCGATSAWILTQSLRPGLLTLDAIETNHEPIERGRRICLNVSIADSWIEPISSVYR